MSVGHAARVIEEAGIPTVVVLIRAFRHLAEEMKIPRTLVTRHLMGRPLGAPGDAERQRQVILAALRLLEEAKEGGTIVELPDPYRPGC
ncbi:MAG: hypothetical protein D6736_04070 [Nitrospinota bacterium]|nr:MAG: hypothetical protein D6736_04070 [Nitrospinota bacterium]